MGIYKHQFDPTGISPTNAITNEIHTVTPTNGFVLVANEGLFYSAGLIVRKISTNAILVLEVDYRLEGFDAEVTALTGQATYAAIALIDEASSGDFSLSYQAVGGREGETSSYVLELRDQIALLALQTATWSAVSNKPSLYPPEAHLHSVITDLTNLNPLRASLERIANALIDARIPTLAGSNLNSRIDRLLAIIAQQRNDLNHLSSVVGGLALGAGISGTETIHSMIISTVNNALVTINATIDGLVTNESMINAIANIQDTDKITGVSQDFAVVNGILQLATSIPQVPTASLVGIGRFGTLFLGAPNQLAVLELGTVVHATAFSWELVGTAATMSIDNGVGALDPLSSNYLHMETYSTDQVFTLTASDGAIVSTTTALVSFKPRIYHGATITELVNMNNESFLALGDGQGGPGTFSDTLSLVVYFNCSGGKYPYYVYPAEFGVPTNVFLNDALTPFTDYTITTRNLVNASGHAQTYNVLKFNELESNANLKVTFQ